MPEIKEKYDFIVSIGSDCTCSGILRARKLQDFSFPFDWLAGGRLKDRVSLVVNDFKDFLNKEDLKLIGRREHPSPCDIYENMHNGLVYNHDFALGLPLETTIKEVNEQYSRRISRMYGEINKAERVLFVYIEGANETNIYSKEELKECYDRLCQKFPDKKITLKYIYNSKNPLKEKFDGLEIISDEYYEALDDGSFINSPKVLESLLSDVSLIRKFSLKRVIDFIFSVRVSKRAMRLRVNIKILGIKLQFTKNAKLKG